MRFLFWFTLALLSIAAYFFFFGADQGIQLASGYFIELALSVDNLVIIYMVFSSLKVKPEDQQRVLFWGILIAAVARIAFIVGGLELLSHFHFGIYIFAGILQLSAFQVLWDWLKGDRAELEQREGRILGFLKRHLRYDSTYKGHAFFISRDGKLWVTTGFIALILVEISDLIFAVDSVPAVLAVTRDPVIAVLSNILAIFGLRSLYSLIAKKLESWRFLKPSLVFVLSFVALKMAAADSFEISALTSLFVVLATLSVGALASWLWPHKKPHRQ